jgi:SNF family Na+-dependent transporter
MNLFCSWYYNQIVVWVISYFYDSFKNPLPWKVDNPDDPAALWNPDYFQQETLEISESISERGRIVPKMAICTAIAYVLIYLTMYKGIESSKYIAYFTVPAPYILLLILLIKGATLEGSG